CTLIGIVLSFRTSDANLSTSTPCSIYNSLCWGTGSSAGISASAAGQIIENNNLIIPGTLTNVTQGAQTIIDKSIALMLHIGQAQLYGFAPEPPFSIMALGGAYGFGNASGFPTLDMLGNPRPSGAILLSGFGTSTGGGTNNQLNDSTQNWPTNAFAGYSVKITGGTGVG